MDSGEPRATELAKVVDTIAAPADAIWDLLTDFAHPQRLSARIESCTASGEGVGAVRTLRVLGRDLHERLLESDRANYRFRYEVLPHGHMPAAHLKSYVATVVLRALSPSRTEITWSSEGEIDGPLETISPEVAAIYRRGIAGLQRLTAITDADASRTRSR